MPDPSLKTEAASQSSISATSISTPAPSVREVSTVSLFTGSTSTGISGGQFNTSQGVTIIINESSSHHARVSSTSEPLGAAPGPPETSELARTTSENSSVATDDTTVEEQSANAIYERQLLQKKHGFPLWIPQPNTELPESYQQTGASIGDVGLITSYGAFDYLFNICLDANHPSNPEVLPENFSPLSLSSADVRKYPEHSRGSYLASISVKKQRGLTFRGSKSEGAVLAMPEGAHHEDLRNLKAFRDYASLHAASWYQFVNGPRGCELENGELHLVTGCDKTTSWGIASYNNTMQSDRTQDGPVLTFLTVPGDHRYPLRTTYSWEHDGMAESKTWPEPDLNGVEDDSGSSWTTWPRNQTTFIRSFTITVSDTIWKNLPFNLASEVETDTVELKSPPSSSSSSQSILSSGRNNGPVVLKDWQSRSPTIHPSTLILKILMQKHPEAKVAIIHDDDWCSVLEEDATQLPDGPEFFNRIQSKFDVVIDQNGTLYLEEKEVSMRNKEVGELSKVDVPKTIGAEVEEKFTLPLPSSSTPLPSSSQTGLNEAAFVPPLTSILPNLSVPPYTGSAQGDNVVGSQPLPTVPAVHLSGDQNNNIPPPMEMSAFERLFKPFCIKLNIDLQQLKIDNKPIDLYQLHRNVMLESGFAMVEQKKLWDVIGGRMGFVQVSGTGTEPAKSGPDIAHRLANIYKEYLFIFERYYIAWAVNTRLRAQPGPAAQAMHVPPPPPSMQGLSSGQGSLSTAMQRVAALTHIPIHELRRRNVPERVIAFLEANRAGLLRAYAAQRVSQNPPQPPAANQNVAGSHPPPLDHPRFQQSYRIYCANKNRKNDTPPQIDDKPVDLYQLHRNVMLESEPIQIQRKGLWSIIGGRMGFAQSPSTELGPAKCSPDAAQKLALVYKELLYDFDGLYIQSLLKVRLQAQGKTPLATKAAAPAARGAPPPVSQRVNAPPPMSQRVHAPSPASQRVNAPSPSMFRSVIVHAHVPASDLHERGVSEKVIEVIEANRGDLQKAHAEQALQNQLRLMQQSTGNRSGPSNTVPNMKFPFGGSAAQQNTAAGSAAISGILQQRNLPNPLQGNNFLGSRQPLPQPRTQWDLPTQQTKEHLDKSNQPMQGINQTVAPTNSSVRPAKRKTPTLLAEAKQPIAKRLSFEARVKHGQESQDTASEQVTEAMDVDENPKVQDTSEVSNIVNMIMEAYDLQESPPLPEPSDLDFEEFLDFSGMVNGGSGSSRAGASELHNVSPPWSS